MNHRYTVSQTYLSLINFLEGATKSRFIHDNDGFEEHIQEKQGPSFLESMLTLALHTLPGNQ